MHQMCWGFEQDSPGDTKLRMSFISQGGLWSRAVTVLGGTRAETVSHPEHRKVQK